MVGVLGSLLSILFPPYFKGGVYAYQDIKGYGPIWGTFDDYGAQAIAEHINIQLLLIQILVVAVIGFGLYFIGNKSQKNL